MRLFLGNCRVSLQCVPRRRFESDCDDSAQELGHRAPARRSSLRAAQVLRCADHSPPRRWSRVAPPRVGRAASALAAVLGAACAACVIGPVQGCPGSFRTWAPRVRSPMWPVAQCARAPASVPIPLDTGMRRCIAQDVAVAGPRVPPPQQRPGTESG